MKIKIQDLKNLIILSKVSQEKTMLWQERFYKAYRELARMVPASHVWRKNKLLHSMEGEYAFRGMAEQLGFEGTEIDVISFVILSHDIGRLCQAIRQENGIKNPWPHGKDSSLILQDLKIADDSPLWKAILFAVEHHDDPVRPTLRTKGATGAALALLVIVRDIDKFAGFEIRHAKRYMEDNEFKKRQINANWADQRRIDPAWRDEKNSVVPAEMVAEFEKGRSLDRNKCQSYEAYMLQYLSWLFDVRVPEIRNKIIAGGGPQVVVDYLERQLAGTKPKQLERVKKTYNRIKKG